VKETSKPSHITTAGRQSAVARTYNHTVTCSGTITVLVAMG